MSNPLCQSNLNLLDSVLRWGMTIMKRNTAIQNHHEWHHLAFATVWVVWVYDPFVWCHALPQQVPNQMIHHCLVPNTYTVQSTTCWLSCTMHVCVPIMLPMYWSRTWWLSIWICQWGLSMERHSPIQCTWVCADPVSYLFFHVNLLPVRTTSNDEDWPWTAILSSSVRFAICPCKRRICWDLVLKAFRAVTNASSVIRIHSSCENHDSANFGKSICDKTSFWWLMSSYARCLIVLNFLLLIAIGVCSPQICMTASSGSPVPWSAPATLDGCVLFHSIKGTIVKFWVIWDWESSIRSIGNMPPLKDTCTTSWDAHAPLLGWYVDKDCDDGDGDDNWELGSMSTSVPSARSFAICLEMSVSQCCTIGPETMQPIRCSTSGICVTMYSCELPATSNIWE